jgi:spermidine synthase
MWWNGNANSAAALAGLGLLSVSTQVVSLRELMVAASGDETAVGLGLAAWFCGIALGAGLARRGAYRHPAVLAAGVLVVLGLWLGLSTFLGRLAAALLAPPAGELPGFERSVLIAALLLLPPGALSGAAFTALVGTCKRARVSHPVSALYVFESAGSLLGGLALTFLLLPWSIPTRGAWLLAAAGWLALLPAARAGLVRGRWLMTTLAAIALAIAATPAASWLAQVGIETRFWAQAPGQELLGWVETPYEHLAVGKRSGSLSVYRSGTWSVTFPDRAEHQTQAHLMALLSPAPRRVLALGDVAFGQLRHLLRHGVESVRIVTIDREGFQAVAARLPAADRRALEDPRVELVFTDPRVELASGGTWFDLILADLPPPETLLLARLTTVETFELMAGRLAADGVVLVPFPTPASMLTGSSEALATSLYATLRQVFPVVRAAPGDRGLFAAGFDPARVTLDPEELAARWRSRGLSSEVFVPEVLDVLYPPGRVEGFESQLTARAEPGDVSRDARPAAFLHALALRQQNAASPVGAAIGRLADVPPAWIASGIALPSLLVFLVLLVRRRSPRPSLLGPVHALAATGACGMIWGLVILLSYQARAGALYGQLGALTGLFMAGLAAGAHLGIRLCRAHGPLAAPLVALAFAAVIPVALWLLGIWPSMAPIVALAVHGLLVALAGLVTGGVVPAMTSRLGRAGVGAVGQGAILEAADHAGAAVGALLGGVVLIPVLGFVGTAAALTAVQALALTALVRK